MVNGMNLFLVCLFSMTALASAKYWNIEFKKSSENGNINHFRTELANDQNQVEKRGNLNHTCLTGTEKSKYCTKPARECFGDGQTVFVHFGSAFERVPKVMIGLTLVDTNKDDNVRVKAEVTSVNKYGFYLKFESWWTSFTYQIGVNWMACP